MAHSELEQGCQFEREGVMFERVRRVANRIQHDRPPERRLVVEVPWLMVFTAFTAPGSYVYFCRRLLERCPDDESAAFVIAHEIAHHDLGHLNLFESELAQKMTKYAGAAAAIIFFKQLQQRLYSPEWEIEADRRAIQLCLAAGYDGRRCARLFDILEQYFLDYGDQDGVFGMDVDNAEVNAISRMNEALIKTRIWLHQRTRGYLPIRERRTVVLRYIDFAGGAPWRTGRPG